MPNVNDLGESKYLKKEDVDPAVIATIEGYENVNVARDNDPPSMRWALKLSGLKPMILNKTNGNRIAKITGSGDFDGWVGKRIELYNDEFVEFAGKITGGIRVRPVKDDASPETSPDVDQDIPF